MAYDFQVTFDAAAPHRLADWWADALGWEVEPSDEDFIRRMIDEGYAANSDTTHHNGALVWVSGAAIRHPSTSRRILFQLVAERTGCTSTSSWATSYGTVRSSGCSMRARHSYTRAGKAPTGG